MAPFSLNSVPFGSNRSTAVVGRLGQVAPLVVLLGLWTVLSFTFGRLFARKDLAPLHQTSRHGSAGVEILSVKGDHRIRRGDRVIPSLTRPRTEDSQSHQSAGSTAFRSPLQRTFAGKHVYVLSHEMSITGAPRVCTELAVILQEAGARVSLATHPDKASSVREMARQVSALIPDTKGVNLIANASIQDASTADLVIVSTAVTWQAAWLRRFREAYPSYPALAWWIHEGQSVMSVFPEADTGQAANIISAQQPRIVDAVVFPSWATRAWWVDRIAQDGHAVTVRRLPSVAAVVHWGLPNWRVHTMDTARSDLCVRAKSRTQRGLDDRDFVFVVLGTFAPLKGYAGIFKAFDLARKTCGPKLRLLVSGMGDPKDLLIDTPELAWVIEDDAVRLEGPTMDVPAFLAGGDAYISNTKAGGETWGLATLEALAMGLPSLVSRAGGSIEMMEHGVAALMHDVASVAHLKDDTEQELRNLAHHMCDLATDAQLRERLGAAGRQLVFERLNQAHIEEALTNTFAGLLQASAGWRRLSLREETSIASTNTVAP